MKRLAIIHTTTATVEPLKALAAEMIPNCEVINFVDDSILPQLARNGGEVEAVEGRLVHYARFACEAGASIILEACSSVGEVVQEMQQQVTIPVVRIDEALAQVAIQRGRQIGVAATLATTLHPTTRLLMAEARVAGKEVRIQPRLVQGAYQKLMSGDKEGHDALVAQALQALGSTCDVVVLAQASMARMLDRLPESERGKFLSSPRLAMARVRAVLEGSAVPVAAE